MAPKKEWRKVVPQEIIEELSSDDDEKIQAPSSPSPASKPKEVKKKVEITVVAAKPKKRQLTEKQKEALEKGRVARHDSSSSESCEGEDSSSSSSSDDEEIQKPRKQRLSQAPPQHRVVFINH
jgi:predicted methyltransferase